MATPPVDDTGGEGKASSARHMPSEYDQLPPVAATIGPDVAGSMRPADGAPPTELAVGAGTAEADGPERARAMKVWKLCPLRRSAPVGPRATLFQAAAAADPLSSSGVAGLGCDDARDAAHPGRRSAGSASVCAGPVLAASTFAANAARAHGTCGRAGDADGRDLSEGLAAVRVGTDAICDSRWAGNGVPLGEAIADGGVGAAVVGVAVTGVAGVGVTARIFDRFGCSVLLRAGLKRLITRIASAVGAGAGVASEGAGIGVGESISGGATAVGVAAGELPHQTRLVHLAVSMAVGVVRCGSVA